MVLDNAHYRLWRMDYGPHTHAVEEVIDTIAQARILWPRAAVDAQSVLVVRDLETATDYAWSRQIAGDESETWNDLRKNQAAPLHLIDDIAGDRSQCARHRALYGVVHESFWEQLWRIYQQGSWPCGWEGEHPAGRIVVFQPKLSAETTLAALNEKYMKQLGKKDVVVRVFDMTNGTIYDFVKK